MSQACGGPPRGAAQDDREATKLTTSPRSFEVPRHADQPQDRLEDRDDLVGEALDYIVASASPLSQRQREALRRRILSGGAQ
jgi:hypothetical protein